VVERSLRRKGKGGGVGAPTTEEAVVPGADGEEREETLGAQLIAVQPGAIYSRPEREKKGR